MSSLLKTLFQSLIELACQYKSLPVIPVIDNLLKIMLYLTFEPEHTKVVDNEQVVGGELTEEVGLSPFKMHELELFDEHVFPQ